jgi:hypothetical protein
MSLHSKNSITRADCNFLVKHSRNFRAKLLQPRILEQICSEVESHAKNTLNLYLYYLLIFVRYLTQIIL